MGYSDANKEAADKNKISKQGMIWDRSCTDMLCCLVFFVFFCGMLVITSIAFTQGDPLKIFTPFDSDGNQCGLPNQGLSNSTEERDFSGY